MTEQGNPHAERIIAGDLWTIVLRPQGSGVNWMLLFFATLAGLSLTILISFLFRRNGILKKANGALKRSGGHDPLTGVYNRKGGDGAVASYMAENPGKKALVIALDIDNFKLVNDVYGHRVGDEALKTLVRDMRETFGEESIITRNGGDEFILFRPYEDFSSITRAMDDFTRTPHTFMAGKREVKFMPPWAALPIRNRAIPTAISASAPTMPFTVPSSMARPAGGSSTTPSPSPTNDPSSASTSPTWRTTSPAAYWY